MASITQDMRFRLSLINYANRYGVSNAARKYKTNRQYIYRWKNRYDGSLDSLRDRSRRPHSHPNQHTPDEIKLIQDMRRRNPHAGLVVFWVKLMQRGYKRSIPGLYRFLKKQGIMAQKLPNPKYIPKPYEQMKYPGQRVQIDVKFVPASCMVNEAKGKRFYQYTAIDEYSRWRYVEAFQEHSTYSLQCLCATFWNAFPCLWNASRQIMVWNSQNVFPLPAKKLLLYSSALCRNTGYATNSSVLLLPGITEKWKEATGKIMNVFMPAINSTLSRIFPGNSKHTTARITISSP